MTLAIIVGVLAILSVVLLIIIDRNKALNEKVIQWISRSFFSSSSDPRGVSERLYSTIKGFAFIFLLLLLLGLVISFGG